MSVCTSSDHSGLRGRDDVIERPESGVNIDRTGTHIKHATSVSVYRSQRAQNTLGVEVNLYYCIDCMHRQRIELNSQLTRKMMKCPRSISSLMVMTHRRQLQQHIHCRSTTSRSLWSKQPRLVSGAGIDKRLHTAYKPTNTISICNDTISRLKNGRTAYMTTSASSSHSSSSFKIFQYALGGWIFFIAENFVLSENRHLIIEYLNGTTDDDESKYRMVYGTFSTIATLSILYGYRQLSNMQQQLGMPLKPLVTGSSTMLVPTMAITMISFGLVLVSQAFPKLQIPIEFSSSSTTTTPPPTATVESTTVTTSKSNSSSTGTGFAFKVRCPFDFSDSKRSSTNDADFVRGMDRITRHSGLWSFGFVGLGNAFLQPTLGLSLFMTGPVLVALVGGYHYDSRLQRNMGGSFPSKQYEQQTSNIPFLAMILGQQKEGNFTNSLSTLMTQELKLLNAAVAVMIGTLYVVLNKGRHVSYIGHILSSSSSQKVATASKLK